MSDTNGASKEALRLLHAKLAAKLSKLLDSGEATAADLNVVRAFLKDNNIEAAVTTKGTALGDLVSRLPFAGTEDGDGKSPVVRS